MLCQSMLRGVFLYLAAVYPLAAAPTYTGAAACAKCHAAEAARWSNSRHSKMLQAASNTSVKGDFGRGTVILRNSPYRLAERGGAYYITESYLTGKPQEHRVEYTLGNRRIQHYRIAALVAILELSDMCLFTEGNSVATRLRRVNRS